MLTAVSRLTSKLSSRTRTREKVGLPMLSLRQFAFRRDPRAKPIGISRLASFLVNEADRRSLRLVMLAMQARTRRRIVRYLLAQAFNSAAISVGGALDDEKTSLIMMRLSSWLIKRQPLSPRSPDARVEF